MPCFWATIRGRWSGLVNHSRPRRIVSRELLVDVLHSGEDEQTLSSSVCWPRAALHSRAVVMNAWCRYNIIVDMIGYYEMNDFPKSSSQTSTSNSQVTHAKKDCKRHTGSTVPKRYIYGDK